MAQPLYPPAGPQSIGQVLDSGFRIFQISFVSCLLYGALSMIAGQLPNIYFIASGRPLAPFGGYSALWGGLYFMGALITLVLYAALLLRQHGIVVGRRPGTSAELSRALRKLPANLGLIAIFCVLLFITVVVIRGILLAAGIEVVPINYGVIALISLVVVVPLTYLLTPLMLGGVPVLLDDKGPLQAYLYLLRLVRGSWWKTTAILTIATVLTTVFYGVAMVVVGVVLRLSGVTDVAAVTASTGAVYVVLGSIGLPFFSAVLLATYGELRVRKEGLDLEQRVAAIS
jgi:hypothetical protein